MQVLWSTQTEPLSNPTTNADTFEYSDRNLPLQDSDIPFPLYVVGPATERSLSSLIESSRSHASASAATSRSVAPASSPFAALNPTISGAHTGLRCRPCTLQYSPTTTPFNSNRIFTFWEAPRLPFIPLVGPGPITIEDRSGGRVRRGGMG